MAAFWQELPLHEMSQQQWESLCDGCARCCLHKLQDDDTEEVFYTNVACELLDTSSCRCQDYTHRLQRIPDCLNLNAENLPEISWLPDTCAYRLLAEGKDLPAWHPLVSGNPQTVHTAGISVRGKVISKHYVHDNALEEHIVHWVKHSL